jgi:glycosyltransferase involved in cell wall biosynthesis
LKPAGLTDAWMRERSDGPEAAPRATSVRGAGPEIILDISRLLSRTRFNAPTGVDRVEMAYAQQLLARVPDRLSFAAIHPWGPYGQIPTRAAAAFLGQTLRVWVGDKPPLTALARATTLLGLLPDARGGSIPARLKRRVYLQVSPNHLDRPRRMRRILLRERARLVCLVHDLIPIEFPEYARPNGPAEHRRRMDAVAELADGVIVATDATRRSLLAHLLRDGRSAKVRVAALGVENWVGVASSPPATAPYFVVVGTIEPRKNHLLLLNLWRELADAVDSQPIPRLVLVGRRGWENENILDMLDRCPGLKSVVEERGHLSDQDMRLLIQGARAVLMPSFAEGFGLPIIEALQMGVPVLCSDIATHREVAGAVAEFLHPLDGPVWRQAILDYAQPASPRRAAQIHRMTQWRAPSWEAHVDAALDLIDEVSQ